MRDTIIDNPILNSQFREPDRHFRFADEGITNDIADTRRASAYFVTGERENDKEAKTATARTLWIPTVTIIITGEWGAGLSWKLPIPMMVW